MIDNGTANRRRAGREEGHRADGREEGREGGSKGGSKGRRKRATTRGGPAGVGRAVGMEGARCEGGRGPRRGAADGPPRSLGLVQAFFRPAAAPANGEPTTRATEIPPRPIWAGGGSVSSGSSRSEERFIPGRVTTWKHACGP